MKSSPSDLHHATFNGYRYVIEVKREPFYWLATTPVLPGVEFRGDAREEVIYKVETAAREGTKLVDWWRRAAMDLLLQAPLAEGLRPDPSGINRVVCMTCGGRFNSSHREPACPHSLRE